MSTHVNGYRLLKKLGSGATAEVFHATKDGKDYAIKTFKDAEHRMESIQKEIESLNRVSEVTHVTRFVEYFDFESENVR